MQRLAMLARPCQMIEVALSEPSAAEIGLKGTCQHLGRRACRQARIGVLQKCNADCVVAFGEPISAGRQAQCRQLLGQAIHLQRQVGGFMPRSRQIADDETAIFSGEQRDRVRE